MALIYTLNDGGGGGGILQEVVTLGSVHTLFVAQLATSSGHREKKRYSRRAIENN